NGARAANGKPALSTRSDLVSIARRHSSRMASQGTIFHNGNLANEAPNDWKTLGENVGMGPACDDIHTAFMNSASHRKNILDGAFNYIGVGVVIAGDGTIYVTQVFMQAAASGSTSTAAPTTSAPRAPRAPRPPAAPRPATPRAVVPAPPPAPPPPPPDPPGAKVKGETSAYFDILETEASLSEAALAEYKSYLNALERLRQRQAQLEAERPVRVHRFFRGVSVYLGGVLSAGI
ncbi:MAG TPA: CAP domain-containing protein, partial [Actinomycetota bacterium]|nr:CAP domain-containing protein [Actinomycetota bacterium]